MPLRSLLDLYAAAFGLIVGSYLNVVIHRVPRGISTVLPRSRCPACGERIRARDNVPLLSHLLLRGRCRRCHTPISWRYPVVEGLAATAFVLSLELFGPTAGAFAAVLLSSLLIALAGIDFEHYLLPDLLTLPGILAGLLVSPWVGWTSWPDSLTGALVGAAVPLALIGSWYLLRKELALGFGDVKMLAMIGAFLGWQGVIITLFFASLSGAVVGVLGIASGRASLKTKLPFGVFLALGGMVSLFAGDELAARYGAFFY